MELTIYSGPQKYLILRFNDLEVELENLQIEANIASDLKIIDTEKFKAHLKEALTLIKSKDESIISIGDGEPGQGIRVDQVTE